MKFVFIMDPIENVKSEKDTSYALICAAEAKGHRVFFTGQEHVFLKHNQVWSRVHEIIVPEVKGKKLRVKKMQLMNLGSADAVFIRTDPPFDRRYFYLTLLTDFLPPSTHVINRPQTLRDWNEKLAALVFPKLTPPTLVANRIDDILSFQEEQDSTLTLKPVDGFGGRGIFFLEKKDRNRDAIISAVTHHESQWVIAQKYIEEASIGDKRILLLNGEPLGAILRVHAEGKDLNNLDAGGSAKACDLTKRDLEICHALKPFCVEKGILFSGIDVIGDYLIEINVTSPTGIQEMSRYLGRDLSQKVIESVELLVTGKAKHNPSPLF